MSEAQEIKNGLPIEETKAKKDPSLGNRLSQILKEPESQQIKGAVSRKNFFQELQNYLKDKNHDTALIALDIIGGGSLAEKGEIIPRIDEIIAAINKFIGQEDAIIFSGRHNYLGFQGQTREVGSDEIFLLVRLGSFQNFSNLLDKLKTTIKEQIDLDAVYAAGCWIERNANFQPPQVMRLADLGLKEAKKAAKEKGNYQPKVILAKNENEIIIDPLQQPLLIPPQALQVAHPAYPDEVITENSASELRESQANTLFILSPKGMKEINQEKGQIEADKSLAALTEKILQILKEKGISKPQIWKIGTLFILQDTSLNQKELNSLAQALQHELTYGLLYDEISNPN